MIDGAGGFARGLRRRAGPSPTPATRAIAANWIKAWPCCLQTHGSIEAAARAPAAAPAGRSRSSCTPVSRQAAAYDDAERRRCRRSSRSPTSIAFALLRGEPVPASFDAVDSEVRAFAAERVSVRTDEALGEPAARVLGVEVAFSPGSPQSPLPPERLAAKVRGLAGGRLDGLLDDPARPAGDLLAALSAGAS